MQRRLIYMIKEKNRIESEDSDRVSSATSKKDKKVIKIVIRIIILIILGVVCFFAAYPLHFVHYKDGLGNGGGTRVWYSQIYVIVDYNLVGEDVRIYPIPYDILISGNADDFGDLVSPDNLWDRYEASNRGKSYYEREHQDPPYSGVGGIDDTAS